MLALWWERGVRLHFVLRSRRGISQAGRGMYGVSLECPARGREAKVDGQAGAERGQTF